MPPATTSAQALQNLQNFSSSAQTPDQQLATEKNSLGVNGDQQQVSGLQSAITNSTNLLSQVAPSVMGRTANSLVTSAQADQQISNEQAPINTQLNQEGQQFDTANGKLTNDLSQAEALAAADQTSQTNQQSYLQNLYNTLSTQESAAASLAEQKREADQTAAIARTSAANSGSSSSSNPGLDLGGLASLLGGSSSNTVGSYTKNAVGGYNVVDGSGKPITLGQYVDANGGSVSDVLSLLAKGSANDQKTAQSISAGIANGSYTPAQLAKLYPQIFGG